MEDEINLIDYIKVILKWKNLIIAVTIVSMLVAFVYSKMQPKMYKAEVTLLSMSSGMGGLASALSSLPFVGGGGQGEGGNIKSIVESRNLARQIALDNDFKKANFPNRWDAANNTWKDKEPTLDETASALRSGISVKNDNLITIQKEWKDPKIAADVANAYAKGMIKFFNQKAINQNLQILDEAVAPERPYNKKTRQNVMVGGGVGLIIGIFLAFFGEYWGKTGRELFKKQEQFIEIKNQ